MSHCCGSGSLKPKKNYNKNIADSAPNSAGKNILIWGIIIILVAGLLVMFI